MEYLLVWHYDAGFRSGTEIKEFETVEEAVEYKEKHKRELGMMRPLVYKKLSGQEV